MKNINYILIFSLLLLLSCKKTEDSSIVPANNLDLSKLAGTKWTITNAEGSVVSRNKINSAWETSTGKDVQKSYQLLLFLPDNKMTSDISQKYAYRYFITGNTISLESLVDIGRTEYFKIEGSGNNLYLSFTEELFIELLKKAGNNEDYKNYLQKADIKLTYQRN